MKKTIRILAEQIEQLKEKKDGTLQGGFAAIKGGFNAYYDSTNYNCTNGVRCSSSTNTVECTNTTQCFL